MGTAVDYIAAICLFLLLVATLSYIFFLVLSHRGNDEYQRLIEEKDAAIKRLIERGE